MTTWFVTGTSKGLGAAIARYALAQGDAVVATARNPQTVVDALGENEKLLTVALDVTDSVAVRAAVTAALGRFGRIDVVVNNAGRALTGALEEMSDRQIRDQFELNVFAAIDVIRATLPTLRAQRSGTIVNLSSTAGVIGFPASSMYNATKFAVEGLTAGLRHDLAPLGISVLAVEPGMFRTGFLSSSTVEVAEGHGTIDDYAGTPAHEQVAQFGEMDQTQDGDPDKLAALLYDVVAAGAPLTRLPVGPDAVAATETRVATDAAELAPWRERAMATNLAVPR
ncbi:SDR family oxidoreductase [Mycolicibacterium sp. F2034L]|uniref:SDR family oxidoreductase n=1 Tax=Mycolicibacterium sp. F2034L TaxID=2926422 RepID=UPI001FF3EF95|nr:SDR family oxidoreductase [Mycolicibacterium sp. F2034L]MCK0175792.1 SDR family oxidoreductase [Mycolicibacterium sp. F2034L]